MNPIWNAPPVNIVKDMPIWRNFGIAMLGVINASFLVWGSEANTAQQLIAVLAAASIGSAALIWIALDKGFKHTPLWWILGLAVTLRLIAVQASPLLEDDHFRYLWDGFRTVTAFDPYRLPPSAYFGVSGLSQQWQDILSGINNPDIPTIYGPVLQWLFALAYLIAPGQVSAIQALVMVVDLAVLGLLVSQRIGARWLLAYAVHPLILKEAIASAHPDGLVALLLLLGLLAWQRRRAAWVGILLGLAVATKVSALLVVPLFLIAPQFAGLRRNHVVLWIVWVMAGLSVSLAILYLPFLVMGGSDGTALAVFSEHWRFNPLLYRFIEVVLSSQAARLTAAALIIIAVAVLALHCQRARSAIMVRPPVDFAIVALLLLAPVVNPWYWLWVLAPAILLGRTLVASIAAVAALSYINASVLCSAGWCAAFASTGPYSVIWPITVVQLVVIGIAWRYDVLRNRTQKVEAR